VLPKKVQLSLLAKQLKSNYFKTSCIQQFLNISSKNQNPFFSGYPTFITTNTIILYKNL